MIYLVVVVGLDQDDFTETESVGAIPVVILKDSKLENPITFRITPMTVDQALAIGVIATSPAENPLSPDRASKSALLFSVYIYNLSNFFLHS